MLSTMLIVQSLTFFFLEFHCPEPPQVSHARPNVSQTRQQHGTVIHYQCIDGYVLRESDTTLRCDKTSWIGDLPTCVAPIHVDPTTTPFVKDRKSAALDENGKCVTDRHLWISPLP